jgi:hypothetical protein
MDLHIEADVIRQYVEENFSLQRMVGRYQELYKDATDTQRKVA